MRLLRTIALGLAGFAAYSAWQRRRNANANANASVDAPIPPDDRQRTPPHGDPIMDGTVADFETRAHRPSQSSRGFGAP